MRATSTSALMRTSQGCRNRLGDRGFLSDPRADRSHGFVRDAEMTCDAPQSFAFGSSGDLWPALACDTRPFGHCGIPANSRSSPYTNQAIGVQEQSSNAHVYLA